MSPCKKYRSALSISNTHHMHQAADCRSCVYFSKYNCGVHPEANPSGAMMSLNMFAFDA